MMLYTHSNLNIFWLHLYKVCFLLQIFRSYPISTFKIQLVKYQIWNLDPHLHVDYSHTPARKLISFWALLRFSLQVRDLQHIRFVNAGCIQRWYDKDGITKTINRLPRH